MEKNLDESGLVGRAAVQGTLGSKETNVAAANNSDARYSVTDYHVAIATRLLG